MKRLIYFLILTLIAGACAEHPGIGTVRIAVSHEANGQPLLTDTLLYANEAGNRYLINEVQWFLSRMAIQDERGEWIDLASTWYIDTDLPETQELPVQELPDGRYLAMRFTFGLNDADNVTGAFSNPPESNMFWPESLGGGYHYMKLNGKYLNADSLLAPLAIHLGRGQNESLTRFYDNSFTVEIPIDATVKEGQSCQLTVVMDIDEWFQGPNTYDFNAHGPGIMQDQEAQLLLKENGSNVFRIQTNDDMKSPLKTTVELLQKAAPKPHFMTWENFKNTISNIKNTKNH